MHLPGEGVRRGLELDSGEQGEVAARAETGERAVVEVAEDRLDAVEPAVDVVERHARSSHRLLVIVHARQALCADIRSEKER